MGVCTPQGSLIADSFWASSGSEPPWCVCARYLAASTHPEGAQVPTWPQDPLRAPLARTEQGQRGVWGVGRGVWVSSVTAPEQRHPEMSPGGQGSVALGDQGHTVPQNCMAWHGTAQHHRSAPHRPALHSRAWLGTMCMIWHRSSHGTAQLHTALHGTARHGLALFGTAQHGLALHGTARHPSRAQHPWPCLAWPCSHQHRTARHGAKPLALAAARHCMARLSLAWHSLVLLRAALHGLAPLSCTQHGSARVSTAGLSLALPQPHTGLLALAHLGLAQLAGHGTARFGSAWLVLVQHGTAHHAMP